MTKRTFLLPLVADVGTAIAVVVADATGLLSVVVCLVVAVAAVSAD